MGRSRAARDWNGDIIRENKGTDVEEKPASEHGEPKAPAPQVIEESSEQGAGSLETFIKFAVAVEMAGGVAKARRWLDIIEQVGRVK